MIKLFFLFVILFEMYGCTTNSKDSNFLIKTNPTDLVRGKRFEILFNTNSLPDSLTNSKDSFSAWVVFTTTSFEKSYRINFKKVMDNSKLFRASFYVPSDAINLHYEIDLTVGNHKKALLNSIPINLPNTEKLSYLINVYNSTSIDTILKYILLERKNHSSSFDYYLHYFKYLNSSNKKKIIDSVINIARLEYIESKKQNELENQIHIAAFISTAYAFVRDYENATIWLDSINKMCSTKNITLKNSMAYNHNLSLILRFYNKSPKIEVHSEIENALIRKLISTATVLDSPPLRFNISKYLHFSDQFCEKNQDILELFIIKTLNDVNELLEQNNQNAFYQYASIFLDLNYLFNKIDEKSTTRLNILNSAIKFYNRVNCYNTSKDTNSYYFFSHFKPIDNYLAETYYHLTQLYYHDNNFINFIHFSHEAFNNILPNGNNNNMLMNIALELSKHYLNLGKIDSAEIFYIKSLNYEYNGTDYEQKYFYKLNQKKSNLGLDTSSFSEFIKKLSLNNIKEYKNNIIRIKTNSSLIDFTTYKDSNMIIFHINDECPMCYVGLPDLLNKLEFELINKKLKIAVISNLSIVDLQNTFRRSIEFIKSDENILKLLRLSKDNFNEVIILNREKIYKINNISMDINTYKKVLYNMDYNK